MISRVYLTSAPRSDGTWKLYEPEFGMLATRSINNPTIHAHTRNRTKSHTSYNRSSVGPDITTLDLELDGDSSFGGRFPRDGSRLSSLEAKAALRNQESVDVRSNSSQSRESGDRQVRERSHGDNDRQIWN